MTAKRLLITGATGSTGRNAVGVAPAYREGLFGATDTITEKVTGKAPMTFEDFLLLNQDTLAAARTSLPQ